MAKVRLFFAIAVVLGIAVIFLPGFAKYQELKGRNNALKKEVERLRVSNKNLVNEITRLGNDMGYIEKVARERLGMIKENEIKYKIVPKENEQNKLLSR